MILWIGIAFCLVAVIAQDGTQRGALGLQSDANEHPGACTLTHKSEPELIYSTANVALLKENAEHDKTLTNELVHSEFRPYSGPLGLSRGGGVVYGTTSSHPVVLKQQAERREFTRFHALSATRQQSVTHSVARPQASSDSPSSRAGEQR